MSLNPGGLRLEARNSKETALFQSIREHEIDIAMLQELGCNWPKLSRPDQWRERVNKAFNPKCTRTRCFHNIHDKTGNRHQWGGTGILTHGPMAHQAMGSGGDKSQLGRWTWARYRGKNGMILRCVSIYRPVPNDSGDASVWSQHKRHFLNKNDDRDPRDAFWQDLQKEMEEWLRDGDQLLIGGDVNDEVRQSSVANFFSNLGLHNLIFEHHDPSNAPTTYRRNTKNKVMDSLWGTASLSATRCGCLEPGAIEGDHSAVWMDISYSSALGHRPPTPHTFNARQLQLTQPKTVKKYLQVYRADIMKQGLPARQFILERSTSHGVPLTPEQIIEAENIDMLKTKAMLRAQKKCRRLYMGLVDFSAAVDIPRKRIQFWEIAVRRRKGLKVSINLWKRRKKKAKVDFPTRNLSQADMLAQLKLARFDYRQAKKNHDQNRITFMDQFDKKVREKLLRIEQARKLGRIARAINGKLDSLSVRRVEHNGIACETQSALEGALFPINKAKVHSSEDTDFLIPPLVNEFGPRGNPPVEDQVLQGSYVPPRLASRCSKLLLRHATIPDNLPITDVAVSTNDHVSGWTRAQEKTTGGKSNLTFAMYKAAAKASKDPILAQFDASQRSMAYSTGYSYRRWKFGVDVQLLKRSGDHRAEKLRTILCLEADHNMNNKKIGRTAMWNGECTNSLARDNLGGRKGMRAVEVSMNQALTYDLIWALRARAVVISNDAKGCFDRIAHVVAILALRRLGIPRPAIESMITTIQEMEHHIRTAFGDSASSYGPNPTGLPPQGILQGNGAGPATWAAITSILVKCMKAEGYGFSAWSVISQRALSLMCFGFIDDTDLILNSKDPSLPTHELVHNAQSELATWEGLISATGGALAPEKSYWYLIDVNPDGSYNTKADSPGDLILNNKGDPVVIERLDVSEAKESLGIWTRPDGAMDNEVAVLKDKARKWADSVRTKRISPTEAWYSVNSTIMKTIEYPLMATCICRKDMQDIMRPILQAALPKAKIQKHFPRKLVYGSLGSEGFGLRNPSTIQLIEHLHAIVCHSHRDSPSHDLHLHNMEIVQCYVGSEKPFWDLPYKLYGPLAPTGWIDFTWSELSETTLSLKGPLDTVKANRIGDVFLIDELIRLNWPIAKIQVVNNVRIYLGITLLSQCCNAAGTHISSDVWRCHLNSVTLRPESWPSLKAPGPTALRAWQDMLKEVFTLPATQYRQLRSPLGPWKQTADDSWRWWLDPSSNAVFEQHRPSVWHKWTALPLQYQQRRFRHTGLTRDSLPPLSQRSTVRVSGLTLRLLDIGTAAPVDTPAAPTSLYAALEALPQSCHWAIQHATFDDDGLTVARAILNNQAVAVSDGSLRFTLGTSAFVVEGADASHRLIGYNRVPGPIKEGDSHRCELAGLYAIVTLVNCLCQYHHVSQGSVTVACDNTGALKPGAIDYLPKSSQKNLDIMQALWKSIQDSPVEWKAQHVYGHQDKKIKDSNRRLAALNCEMDSLAKQHWARVFREVQFDPAPHIPIHNEGWTIWDGTTKLTSPSRNALYDQITDPITQSWWVWHKRITAGAQSHIDWENCATSIPCLKPSRRRWITKHASAQCGVGITLLKWKYQTDAKCPRCNLPESTAHVLTCTGMGANDTWNKSMSKVTQYLVDAGTHPELQEAILENLSRWRRSQLPQAEFFDSNISEAVQSQTSIGWKNLLEGLFSSKWRQLQQRHYNSQRRRRSSKQWAKGLFLQLHNLAWNQWDHRNNIKHRILRPRHQSEIRALNNAICLLYRTAGRDLPPDYRDHYRFPLVPLLKKSYRYKKHWFSNVMAARQHYFQHRHPNPSPDSATPEQLALLRWMETGIPR